MRIAHISDILVEYCDGHKVLEEPKGWIRNEEVFKLKCEAAIKYCSTHNIEYKVIFKEQLFD